MKCMLIFPPQTMPENPYLSTPMIKGILNKAGHETEQLDLNLDFYNYILRPEYIKKTLDDLYADYEKNAEKIFNQYDENKNPEEYSYDYINQYIKYAKIKEINKEEAYESVNLVGDYINIIKTGTESDARVARVDVWTILGYLFLPYFDQTVLNQRYFYYIRNFEQLTKFLDRSKNIFYPFYEEIIPEIIEKQPDFIGISICYLNQLLPGLTLAKMLKEKTNAHISIGGTYFSHLLDTLENRPEIFEQFIDSLIYEEGEKPILELMKHLEGKISIEEVPNLVYLKDGKVKINEKTEKMPLNDIPVPDFSGLPMESYFSSERIIPMLAERGCYWAKCTFCNLGHTGSRYYFKDPELVVSEIKELQKQIKFSKISFVGEAMSPAYLRKLSNEIIKSGLKIKFMTYTRIEKEFTKELFELAKKAGAVEFMWGFESVNERVLKLMNKTNFIDKKERLEVIKAAYDAGIENTGMFILGFPTETKEEAMETVEFIEKNTKYISKPLISKYIITDHSPIAISPETFSVYNIKPKEEFDLFFGEYEIKSGMSNQELNEIYEECNNYLYVNIPEPYSNFHHWAYSSMFWGF